MAAAGTQGAPLEAYGHLPSMSEVSISPDGTRIAYVRAVDGNRFVAIAALTDTKPPVLLPMGDLKIRSVEWGDDRHPMVVTSKTTGIRHFTSELAKLNIYDIDRKRWTVIPDDLKLSDFPDGLGGVFRVVNAIAERITVRQINGRSDLFFRSYVVISPKFWVLKRTDPGFLRPLRALMEADVDSSRPLPALIQIDLDSGAARLIRIGSEDSTNWLLDPVGNIVAEQRYSEKDQRWSLSIRRDGGFREIAGGTAGIEFPLLLGFGPTTDTLLVTGGELDEAGWKLLSLSDGRPIAPPAEGISFDAPIEDRLTGRLMGGSRVRGTTRTTFFDASTQGHWDTVARSFEDGRVQLASASDDFSRLVVLVDGPKSGYRYELVDAATGQARRIGDVYDGITEPLEVRSIVYSAADALPIPAYLTLPRNRAEKNLALVVLVHGGPAARDTADFDWWSQALADRGYLVLRPNYRGSTVSRQFLTAGFGEYGRKMQTDLSDGVRYLVREGIVDPARVCIVGASYGGYAALAGVTLDPGVYRCAVSIAGLSDLKEFLGWVDEKHDDRSNLEQRYWDRFMGVTGPNDPVLDRISPIKHIESVNVPVLLIHGKDDTVVPYGQSEEMYRALRRANKPVEFVRLNHEDHWLSRSDTRLQMLQATVEFLQKNNPID